MNDRQQRRANPTPTRLRASSRRLVRTAAVCAGLSLLPPLAHAACQVDSTELPIRMAGSRAVTTVVINGQTVPLVVDSGAFFSTLTEAAANQLKLPLKQAMNLRVSGVTGRVDTQMATVDKLGLLHGEIPRVQFLVGVSEPGAGTMGLLGRNILSATDTEYDLAHGAIRFMMPTKECADRDMAYWAGSTPVTEIRLLTEERTRLPAIRAHVRLNGVELVALFDTGATTTVSERAARRVGIAEADLKPFGTMTGAGSGRARLSTAVFDRFQIGGEVIRNNRLMVGDMDIEDADLLLGIDFFLSHRLYIAKDRDTMFFTYNGGTVFTLDRDAAAKTIAKATEAAPDAAGDADTTTADQFARRGAASAARRDYEGALADLDRAVALEPASAVLFAQRGLIQRELKHPAKAREDFDQALKLDPAQSGTRLLRAVLRLDAKDRDGAQADLDALDRTVPAQSPMRLTMAGLYAALEQPAKSIAQLDAWLDAHPNDSARGGALNSRCRARVTLGTELPKAIDDCDDALKTDADNAAYLDSRGWAYYRSEKYQKALADFERSVAARPGFALALYGRGLAKTRLGDTAQGDADLAAARKAMADIDTRLSKIGIATGS